MSLAKRMALVAVVGMGVALVGGGCRPRAATGAGGTGAATGGTTATKSQVAELRARLAALEGEVARKQAEKAPRDPQAEAARRRLAAELRENQMNQEALRLQLGILQDREQALIALMGGDAAAAGASGGAEPAAAPAAKGPSAEELKQAELQRIQEELRRIEAGER
ncbi:MAG: hypothetical protein HZA54_08900 [Planctomycetes bacterium]|nr:hypothetical protein [Planctomycetota bacterium]